MTSTELIEYSERQFRIEWSARQFPIDANVIHTFGQLIAAAAPLIAIQALSILSVVAGVALVGVITSTFSEETTVGNNFDFGLLSGGVFSTISTQYQESELAAQRLTQIEDDDQPSSGVPISLGLKALASTTCDTNFYKESDGTTCTACNCDATGSSSLQCADSTGQCTCNAGYKGTKCDATCGCDGTGSSGTACDQSTGQCTCNAGYKGATCGTACGCDATGSSSTACDASTGQCTCKSGYSGTTCNTLTCSTNFYKASDGTTCTACNCDATGSSSLQCADSTGQCTCNAGYKGTKCDATCGCDSTGSSGTACDASSGQCTCKTGYTGTTCNSCATNYYKTSDGTCTGEQH